MQRPNAWPSLGEITGLAGECSTLAEFRGAVLSRLATKAGCSASVFRDAGPDAFVAPDEQYASTFMRLRSDWGRYGRQTQPLLRALRHERVTTDVQTLGAKAFARTDYHQEIMKPLGVYETLYVHVALGAHTRPALIAFSRRPGEKPFPSATLGRLRRLLPALSLANAALPRNAPPRLTPRERDLVDFVCLGYTNKQIACATQLSVNTVRNRLARLFAAHGIASRAELAHRFGQ